MGDVAGLLCTGSTQSLNAWRAMSDVERCKQLRLKSVQHYDSELSAEGMMWFRSWKVRDSNVCGVCGWAQTVLKHSTQAVWTIETYKGVHARVELLVLLQRKLVLPGLVPGVWVGHCRTLNEPL